MDIVANLQPFKEANGLLGDEEALRASFEKDGYIFVKQLIDPEKLIAIRQQFTAILAQEGWIKGGAEQDKAFAIGMPYREGEPEFLRAYEKIQKVEDFHALAHDPALNSVISSLLGMGAFPPPLSIARLIFTNNEEIPTPPHQDFPNNQGSANLTASWMPLIDCPISHGSLAVLEGSHKFGLLPLTGSLGAGNRQAVLPPEFEDLNWVGADFELGDVLFFSALTVHTALPNRHAEKMRLSVDFRFQPAGAAITELCLEPHFQTLSWDEIYENLQDESIQYYWRDNAYEIVPFDAEMHKISDEEHIELVAQSMRYQVARNERAREQKSNVS